MTAALALDGGGTDPAVDTSSQKLSQALASVLAATSPRERPLHAVQRTVLTGAGPEADASSIALRLATESAERGFRTLLVDANFTAPHLHVRLDLSNERGLSTMLGSVDAPQGVLQRTPVRNLIAISNGEENPNWPSLLATQHLFHRLLPVYEDFDHIFVDAAGLSAIQVARLADGAEATLVVVRQHATSMRDLGALVDTLKGEGVSDVSILMVE